MRDVVSARFEALFGPEFGHGRALDTQRLREALAALGAPHQRLAPVIHVAGTNGKGSTIAFLRAMAGAAGLRTHAFTKPHLFSLRERFLVAGEFASDEALIATAERVAAVAPALTQFDAQVASALLLFAQTPADLVLLETGMGGRDDSTNVIPAPALALLTPIGMDHAEALGGTLAQIARHKAGIIKPGATVLSVRQRPEAMAVIEEEAERRGARLLLQGRDWDAYANHGRLVVQTEDAAEDFPPPALRGPHQYDNAGLAAAATMFLARPRLTAQHRAAGVADAVWPGRMQPLTNGALAAPALAAGAEVWIDGAHNADGAAALHAALARLAPRPTAFVVGMWARKDAASFFAALAPARVIAVALQDGDDARAETLAEQASAAGADAETAASLEAAVQRALSCGAQRIVICGSLALAAEALAPG